MNNKSYAIPMGNISQDTLYNIEVKRAEDTYLYDVNNKRYIDLRSGLWNVSLGYNKKLNKNITEKMSDLLELGIPYLDIHSYTHTLYEQYSSELLDFVNEGNDDYNKVIYTNSGSEGTEAALKIVRQISNQQKKVLAFNKGYHGTFFGGMSVSGLDQDLTKVYSPLLHNIQYVNVPENEEQEEKIIDYIEKNHKEFSAFFLEPILGSAGTILFSEGFMKKLLSILKLHEIIVVFDEVATGFLRTGHRFFLSKLEIKPDMIILSKGINNGTLPFGAVILNGDVCDKLLHSHVEHFSTQNGNLLGITSAFCTLNYIKECENEIKSNINEIESYYKQYSQKYNLNVRGQGLMLSLPINDWNKTRSIMLNLKSSGLLVYYYYNDEHDNGLTLLPSLLIDKQLFMKSLNIIARKVALY
ncbi:aminotransferase class III-fold pyridoxal phosphate-dependent enzyme [Bacillus cabrialesii]|uniref:aminotransferase class III-fold pyridoxal phosphate-dependent enzyme n=1 Tax=Bacillus TaxID=1386 RepID=UPI0005EED04E|nr:aminotransferase class III-fold pyridoxal phosphate-dependent enzyme [Bacillus spizizenii]MCY7810430.1 aminotransferase class III-fold pyridoxal phosphate-dependent enzyme [Bacillus spizizenii]MCY7880650.1 aminotransferase class III-fold pyridoxal phosphate-dependent enzyme [Bacillus spizizenii]MCY7888661.1 aminotransferase class III-fold pyridoxal phosphate-dependent enzyme [Bacillus spizizenii]MCY7932560.1 aminotransferase class III-fold pyridoxal phosphate-dependent enzyme [Bacillus spizi